MVPESSTREIISFGDEEPDPAEYAGGKASPSRTPCCSHLRPFKLFFPRLELAISCHRLWPDPLIELFFSDQPKFQGTLSEC